MKCGEKEMTELWTEFLWKEALNLYLCEGYLDNSLLIFFLQNFLIAHSLFVKMQRSAKDYIILFNT